MKIDLHTHSTLSYDGGLTLDDYRQILDRGVVDYIAISDHNEVDFALNARSELGERIIVAEEIYAKEGEIIGLFLREKIPAKLSVKETIAAVKHQGGLVYVPHPYDIKCHAVPTPVLESVLDQIDIIEAFNARSIIPGTNPKALKWAIAHEKLLAAGSDSHSRGEVGRSYTILDLHSDTLDAEGLKSAFAQSLGNTDKLTRGYIRPWNILVPARNKIRKRFL